MSNPGPVPARVVHLDAEALDAAVVPALAADWESEVGRGPVVFDLSRVRFADSVGLGLLVRLRRSFGPAVAVTNVGPSLQRCFSRVSADLLPRVVAVPASPRVDLPSVRLAANAQAFTLRTDKCQATAVA